MPSVLCSLDKWGLNNFLCLLSSLMELKFSYHTNNGYRGYSCVHQPASQSDLSTTEMAQIITNVTVLKQVLPSPPSQSDQAVTTTLTCPLSHRHDMPATLGKPQPALALRLSISCNICCPLCPLLFSYDIIYCFAMSMN